MKKYISQSQINTFRTCKFKYYCKYIIRANKIKVDNTAALFGEASHKIVESYYEKIDSTTSLEEILKSIEEAFVEGSDYRVERKKTVFRRCQKNFVEWERYRIRQRFGVPAFTEKTFTNELFKGILPVNGIVDAYFDKVEMWVDWKTGNSTELTEQNLIQGKVYEMLLKYNGYPVKKGLFVNLNKGVRIPMPKISDNYLETRIHDMLAKIDAEDFSPTASGLCNKWCEYRLACDLKHICPWEFVL